MENAFIIILFNQATILRTHCSTSADWPPIIMVTMNWDALLENPPSFHWRAEYCESGWLWIRRQSRSSNDPWVGSSNPGSSCPHVKVSLRFTSQCMNEWTIVKRFEHLCDLLFFFPLCSAQQAVLLSTPVPTFVFKSVIFDCLAWIRLIHIISHKFACQWLMRWMFHHFIILLLMTETLESQAFVVN